MDIGTRIAHLREQRGWTQEQTSQSLGISRAALSHYEKNRREPDTETLTKFADLFNVTIDFLVGRTNKPEQALDPQVREFVELTEQDPLELSDDDLLKKFALTVDGTELTLDEAKRFIAFIRYERSMR
ncbi:helix-turn-helix domain-containing protein [Paenibacillus sp. MMS18-CY102]|uniref:helix-turn-helix domain-containing protein n=1 Tax=Paenibacillus sp. MMS18-CY102 TaxID=2682849 RepID=UPI001365C104|nr:helix-turn-helix domain-containing protein [Paenibacillus sp. MMS18-CY102]MWC30438.1 helix-turn-helix domain-containing protein [Paenibacillus sp. MMS18-CY102]